MAEVLRYTKTFTEIQKSIMVDNDWTNVRVSDVALDDQINAWVVATKNVIIEVFSSVDHSSVVSTKQKPGEYFTKVQYIVVYMRQNDFQLSEQRPLMRLPLPGGKTPPAVVGAESRGERMTVAERYVDTGAVLTAQDQEGDIGELENPEEAEAWQEEETAPGVAQAKQEVEELVTELNRGIQEASLPKTRSTGVQKTVQNPSPPIRLELPTKDPKSNPNPLSHLPNRRSSTS